MNGAIGVAKYVATEGRLKRLQDLQCELQKLEREVSRTEHDTNQVLREEEGACASHARRLQARAEVEDSLQRMQRNPGVSFLGYESPARRRLAEMKKAISEHARAATVAQERYELARGAGKRARGRLASRRATYNKWLQEQQLERDPRQLDFAILQARETLEALTHTISEAEIDESAMHNRVQMKDAARVRQALRERQPVALVR